MASASATKRLTKEYRNIHANPPPYISAHPNEENILEWHYIITGPPDTPYKDGQYWGTLLFPPDYPFAPPAIRMYTPSGRFQPGARLCLSISDFHPKSFNPAWEVSTILNGLLSFMTSEEMTTGSVQESTEARRAHAFRSRWWNSTGGGSFATTPLGVVPPQNQNMVQAIKKGDRGEKFRKEFPELDAQNWEYIRQRNIDPRTGRKMVSSAEGGSGPDGSASGLSGGTGQALRQQQDGVGAGGVGGGSGLRRRGAGGLASGLTTDKSKESALSNGQSWFSQHKYLVGAVVFLGYVLATRIFGPGLAHHVGSAAAA